MSERSGWGKRRTRNTLDFYARIGKAIEEIRIAVGWTQQDLAEAVGLTRTSITNIEHGRHLVQLHTILLIAQTLEVPYWSFIPEDYVLKPRRTIAPILTDEARA